MAGFSYGSAAARIGRTSGGIITGAMRPRSGAVRVNRGTPKVRKAAVVPMRRR